MAMLSLLLLALIGAIAGACGGSLFLWWQIRRHHLKQAPPIAPSEDWLAAEIDQAAATWATTHGRPEAAGLMADKLHLLHHLGQRRQGRRP
jgi:hypothetical protein